MKKLLATLLFAAPALALAHPGHESSGLMAGLWHPIGGWDHLLAMLAVGLWAASFSGKARWLIPASFVGVMALGFVFGANGGEMPMMEQGIAASVLVLGLAAAWAKRVPVAFAADPPAPLERHRPRPGAAVCPMAPLEELHCL